MNANCHREAGVHCALYLSPRRVYWAACGDRWRYSTPRPSEPGAAYTSFLTL